MKIMGKRGRDAKGRSVVVAPVSVVIQVLLKGLHPST